MLSSSLIPSLVDNNIHKKQRYIKNWIPAFAGMTDKHSAEGNDSGVLTFLRQAQDGE
jgi:hypothetical protein